MTTGKKIAIGCGFGFPLVCCLGGYLVIQGAFGKTAGNLQTQLAAARREGIPVTPEELEASLKTTPDRNAAPVYREAIAMVTSDPKMAESAAAIEKWQARGGTDEERKEALAALDRLKPLIDKVALATERPSCVWDRDWGKGASLLFPEYAHLRTFSRILAFRAEVQDERGDWRGALDSIRMTQVVARQVGEDPILIGMLVDVSSETAAASAFERLIAKRAKTPGFAEAAQKVFDDFGPLPSFRRALGGEVVTGRSSIRNIKDPAEVTGQTPDGNASGASYEKFVFRVPMVIDAFDAKFIEAYRKMYAGIPSDPEKWQAASQVCDQMQAEIEADKSLDNSLNKILFPVFSHANEAIGRLQMHRRLIGTALRLILDRERTGAYPAVLPDYGSMGMDPFGTGRLHYDRVGSGFRLYSVGLDRTDDDGKAFERGKMSEHYDEVLSVP